MQNACALNGSADKLGLTDAVWDKAGSEVRVFFLSHAGLDNAAAVRRVIPFAGHGLHLLSLIAVFGANLHPVSGSNSQGFSKTESPLLYNFCFLRLPDVLGTRFTPAINSCGLSSDGLRRLLSRSDDPGWGVAALCCHRPPGTTRLSRSWRCSLAPMREVLARPSARLSQGACCLKKLFTCQGTPCRRGQTVTGSGTGRAFRLGSPSQHTTDIFSLKLGTAGEKIFENLSTLLSESAPGFVPTFCPFTLQRTKICRLLSMAARYFFLRESVSA